MLTMSLPNIWTFMQFRIMCFLILEIPSLLPPKSLAKLPTCIKKKLFIYFLFFIFIFHFVLHWTLKPKVINFHLHFLKPKIHETLTSSPFPKFKMLPIPNFSSSLPLIFINLNLKTVLLHFPKILEILRILNFSFSFSHSSQPKICAFVFVHSPPYSKLQEIHSFKK